MREEANGIMQQTEYHRLVRQNNWCNIISKQISTSETGKTTSW